MNKVFIFPGQGSQTVGMGKDLYENFSVAKQVFEEVDNALGENLSKIIFSGSEEELTQTHNTQPALMAVSVAIVKMIENLSGKSIGDICSAVAGHSLGQYSAICAGGGLKIGDCARILRARGRFMQKACPEGEGAMAAILGASKELLEDVILSANKIGICDIANENSTGQIVISGDKNAIDFAVSNLKAQNIKAIRLKVSAPFHSRLMKSASERMMDVLENVDFRDLKIPVIDNTTLERTTNSAFLKKALIDQITATIRWRETMDIIASNYNSAVEVGSGKVLTTLFKKQHPSFISVSISNLDDIEDFIR